MYIDHLSHHPDKYTHSNDAAGLHYDVTKPEDQRGERATLLEAQEFCNKVRRAGGANPLDALLPAIPACAEACLIARNLNFSCSVGLEAAHSYFHAGSHARVWTMSIDNPDLVRTIAEALNLDYTDRVVILPERIGNIAEAFDASAHSPEEWPKYQDLLLTDKEAIWALHDEGVISMDTAEEHGGCPPGDVYNDVDPEGY